MEPPYNFTCNYGVIMLTRQEGTSRPRSPAVEGFVWYTDGSRMQGGWGWKKAQYCSRRYATIFQVKVYATFACVYEIYINVREVYQYSL